MSAELASWNCNEAPGVIRRLEEMGCLLIRHGAKHDWYQSPNTKIAQPVPRHVEIKTHSENAGKKEPIALCPPESEDAGASCASAMTRR